LVGDRRLTYWPVACAGGGRMHGDWAGGGRFTVLAGVAYDFRACIALILFCS